MVDFFSNFKCWWVYNNTFLKETRTFNAANEMTNYSKILNRGGRQDTVTARYRYNPDGWRISKQINEGDPRYYLYQGNNVLCEKKSSLDDWTYHLYFGMRKLADIKADGEAEYYYTDHIGTVNMVADQNVEITHRYVYGPFGNMEYNKGSSDNRYIYTGKEYDSESGLWYIGARYYDSRSGGWIGRDPQEEFYSAYCYVGNNPYGYFDPDGEEKRLIIYENFKKDWLCNSCVNYIS